MEEDSPPLKFEEQKREAIYHSLEAIGRKLFPDPDNPLIIRGIMKLEPLPLAPSLSPLIIIRANKDGSFQGCFLDLEALSTEAVKESGDSIKVVSEKLCKSNDSSLEKVRGGVVFMEPEVDLRDIESDIQEMIGEFAPEAQLWFVEAFSLPSRLRRKRRTKKEEDVRYLHNLGLVYPRSVRKEGKRYSTGKLPAKEKAKSRTSTQAQLELISQK